MFHPLFSSGLRSCFIEAAELFALIESERTAQAGRVDLHGTWVDPEATATPNPSGRPLSCKIRVYALLGPNLPWRDILARHRATSPLRSWTTVVSTLLSWLLIGHLISLALKMLARLFPVMRQWDVRTLEPRSIRELLSLCHQGNLDYVKVVGYNNGVVHFGHRYAGKTIVSTVRCQRLTLSGRQTLKADCGATVRQSLDFLATHGKELFVVPNYSYVSLGTAFFVPIHGSAVDYSTVADTIRRVVLYDPESDRVIAADRDEPAFIDHVYNLNSSAVALRLYLLTKPKTAYFVHHETWENPSAGDIFGALADRGATNVEIRQAHSASSTVKVSRYYNDPGEASAPALELPRDALGRLWDRLEENPITSYLMHAVGRHVVWHAELFLTFQEFELFWRTHARLPLRKVQLRYLRRDGLTHSPFRDEDRVSADLFLFRWHRLRFQEYLKNTLPTVRTNPGKHSN